MVAEGTYPDYPVFFGAIGASSAMVFSGKLMDFLSYLCFTF